MKKYAFLFLSLVYLTISCSGSKSVTMNNENTSKTPFVWEGANVYFLLTEKNRIRIF